MSNPNPSPATRFRNGQSGNPAGRPKGLRDRIGRRFLKAMSADFAEHGASAIEALRKSDPAAYVRIFAAILPREVNVEAEVRQGTPKPIPPDGGWDLEGLRAAAARSIVGTTATEKVHPPEGAPVPIP